MSYQTGIRLFCVAQNPANGFPARLLGVIEKDFAAWDRASENLDELRTAGEALLRKQQALADAQARAAQPCTVAGRRTLAAPCDELRSETANAILDQNPELDFAAVYHRTK